VARRLLLVRKSTVQTTLRLVLRPLGGE
jgi:hypothetical protein